MLEHFFGSKTRVKLLKTFFRSPDRTFYVRELARLIETQLNAVRREIANLEKVGLLVHVSSDKVSAKEFGTERSKFYQLNTGAMLYAELKALLMKAELMQEQQLMDEIRAKAGSLKLFLLTGQFTHEGEVGTDMVLVGTVKPLVVAKIIERYEGDLGKSIRYTVMDEQEFRDRQHIGDRFLYSIFEAKHVMLVNDFNVS